MTENNSSSSEPSLRDVIAKLNDWKIYLHSKWITICIAGFISAMAGFAYSIFSKPLYTAETTFVLEESGMGSGLGQYAGVASLMGIDIGSASNNGLFTSDNIIELYKSRTMLIKTLLTEGIFNGKKQLIVDRYIDSYGLRKKWNKDDSLRNINFNNNINHSLKEDSVLREISKEINKNLLTVAKPDKNLSIIKVQVKSTDELFAKEFTNHIVGNVNDFYVHTKTKKSLDNLKILQHQTDSVRTQLNQAISGVAFSIDLNPNPNPSRQILKVPSQRRQIDAEANKAILTELVKSLEMSKVSLRKETPLIQVIDEPVLPLDKTRVGKLRGIVFGGLIGVFLIVLILLVKRISAEILQSS